MIVVIVCCPTKADGVEGAAEIVLCRNDIEELSEGELLGIPNGKTDNACVKSKKKMSLETQTARRESAELDPAMRT